VISKASPGSSKDVPEQAEELDLLIAELSSGNAAKESLQRVALICMENGVAEPDSPTSPSPFVVKDTPASLASGSELWDSERRFARLFGTLLKFLEPTKVDNLLFQWWPGF